MQKVRNGLACRMVVELVGVVVDEEVQRGGEHDEVAEDDAGGGETEASRTNHFISPAWAWSKAGTKNAQTCQRIIGSARTKPK